jgi:magnesium transporter
MGRPVADADGVVIMKMLASITIVISLPTMVSSFYGMNVSLPLDEHPVTFLAILAAAFALSLGAAFVFWKKDWL